MRWWAVLASGCLLAALGPACRSKPLQNRDGTGVITLDGGADADPADSGGTDPADSGSDLSFDVQPHPRADTSASQRSFVVTSVLQVDGGGGVGPIPSSHTFTMVVDTEWHTVLMGSAQDGATSFLESTTAGEWRLIAPVSLGKPSGCSGWTIRYTDLRFTIEASNRLTGTGQGQISVLSGDVGGTVNVTMTLIGVPDAESPTLTLSGAFTDPFGSFQVNPSEPLPLGSTAVLRTLDQEETPLKSHSLVDGSIGYFAKPSIVLRYQTLYRIVADGLTDFAGNPVGDLAGTVFMTPPVPTLVTEDGFEYVLDANLGGAQVLSGDGAPTITGTKSLYVPAATGMPPTQPPLALRLRLNAGDTVVRFAYRAVTLGPSSFDAATWVVGSVGGTIGTGQLPAFDATMTTTAMIGGTPVTLGPVTTASFNLPSDTGTEVILQRTMQFTTACGPPRPSSVFGILIDDLRAE